MPSLTDPIGAAPRSLKLHRAVVRAFGLAMVAKLDANAHKTNWRLLEFDYLLRRLGEEYGELLKAIAEDAGPEAVRGECVDIANMAAMLFDVLRSEAEQDPDQAPGPLRFKAGDRVRLKNLDVFHPEAAGRIGTVKAVRPSDEFPYVVKPDGLAYFDQVAGDDQLEPCEAMIGNATKPPDDDELAAIEADFDKFASAGLTMTGVLGDSHARKLLDEVRRLRAVLTNCHREIERLGVARLALDYELRKRVRVGDEMAEYLISVGDAHAPAAVRWRAIGRSKEGS